MNKFEKCKECYKHKNCEYLARGETCNEELKLTAYESRVDCAQGKFTEVNFNKGECDIRMDLCLEERRGIKIWGQVRSSYGIEVEDAMVTLFKTSLNDKLEYIPIATTFTDSMGFYQFYIETLYVDDKYRVSANKH